MTTTPIFDDLVGTLAASLPARELGPTARRRPDRRDRTEGGGVVVRPVRRPSPRPRRPAVVVGPEAFGHGCLAPGVAPDSAPVRAHGSDEDEVGRLVAAARREAVALGRRRVGTVHLLLAAVRAGGDVGRAFGLRGIGPAVLGAALAPGGYRPGDGGTRPPLSAVARTLLRRLDHRAADTGRAETAADLALASLRTVRVVDLLCRAGVDGADLADLVDALQAGIGADTAPEAVVGATTIVLARVRLPAPVVPITVVLPTIGPATHRTPAWRAENVPA